MNAVEIEQAVSELAEQHFDREDFPLQFLAAFGNKDTTLKRLRTGVSNKSDVGGVRQTNNIHIATCTHVLPRTVRRRDSTLRLTLSRWRPLANIIPGSGFAGSSLGGERTDGGAVWQLRQSQKSSHSCRPQRKVRRVMLSGRTARSLQRRRNCEPLSKIYIEVLTHHLST